MLQPELLLTVACVCAERTPTILDEAPTRSESVKGVGGVSLPIDLQAGNLTLKVVPWIGGRIVSMIHIPSGYEWLEGRFETGCYEEYSGSEYRAAGCTEEYQVVRYFSQAHLHPRIKNLNVTSIESNKILHEKEGSNS